SRLNRLRRACARLTVARVNNRGRMVICSIVPIFPEESNENFTFALFAGLYRRGRGHESRMRSLWLLYTSTQCHAANGVRVLTFVGGWNLRCSRRAIHSLCDIAVGWKRNRKSDRAILEQLDYAACRRLRCHKPLRATDQCPADLSRVQKARGFSDRSRYGLWPGRYFASAEDGALSSRFARSVAL